MPNKLISIITINYNQSKVTCDLIRSLYRCSFQNFEIIVVDNASPNDTPDDIKKEFPNIHLLKSKENLGFAGGNNLGVRMSKGEYVLFINNDVEVEKGFLEPLIDVLNAKALVGVVSPKIYFHNTDNVIQYAGCTEINPFTTRGRFIGHKQSDKGQFNTLEKTHYAHGAGMMVKREVIEKVGMMPELYFLYYEEMDWCNRIKEQGYEIFYVPESIINHKESMSVGKASPLKTYYQTRNRLIYLRRNIQGITFLISLLYFMFLAFPKNILTHLFKSEFHLLKSYWRGAIWHLQNFTLDKR